MSTRNRHTSLAATLAIVLFGFTGTTRLVADEAGVQAVEGTVVEIFGQPMTVPAAFTPTEPGSSMLAHEFVAKSGEGEDAPAARVTFMAAGGGVKPNLDRWKGQFSGDAKKVGEVDNFTAGKFTVHLLEVSGKYVETMGGGPFSGGKKVVREDYGMLGAILEDPAGPLYFIKMIGPKTVIDANQKPFKSMLQSVGQ